MEVARANDSVMSPKELSDMLIRGRFETCPKCGGDMIILPLPYVSLNNGCRKICEKCRHVEIEV